MEAVATYRKTYLCHSQRPDTIWNGLFAASGVHHRNNVRLARGATGFDDLARPLNEGQSEGREDVVQGKRPIKFWPLPPIGLRVCSHVNEESRAAGDI